MSTGSYDALVIAARPDDAEAQMGGNLAKLAETGQRFLLIDLTDGEPTEFADVGVRAAQATEAARILGVECACLGLQDRLLTDTPRSDWRSRPCCARIGHGGCAAPGRVVSTPIMQPRPQSPARPSFSPASGSGTRCQVASDWPRKSPGLSNGSSFHIARWSRPGRVCFCRRCERRLRPQAQGTGHVPVHLPDAR
jgi:hypothetical protein